jgi:hypothetical protein
MKLTIYGNKPAIDGYQPTNGIKSNPPNFGSSIQPKASDVITPDQYAKLTAILAAIAELEAT